MEGLFPPPVCTGDIYIFVKKRKGAGGGSDRGRIEAPRTLTHLQCASLGPITVILVPLCSPGAPLGAPFDGELCSPGLRLESGISQKFLQRVGVG